MVLISRYHKKCRVASLRVGLLTIVLSALFIPTIEPVRSVGNNIFTLYVGGTEIGKVENEQQADELLIAARKQVVGHNTEVLMIEAESKLVGEEVLVGTTDDPEKMKNLIVNVYEASVKETMSHAYTVKIDDYVVNVSSADNVVALLQASIDRYVGEGLFQVRLTADDDRELPVFVPVIEKIEQEEEESEVYKASDFLSSSGIYDEFDAIFDGNFDEDREKGFDDYDYGVIAVSFDDKIEVAESYLPNNQITNIATAIDEVTKDKEEKTIYEVVSGDTLSGISLKTGITIDQIIELNENITGVNSIIRVGDEITVTVPQPELSVNREELVYYEGTYEADIIYQYNDNWYTTKEVTLQEPSSGFHRAVQKITYYNNKEISTETIKEEVVAEAVPRIIEKGTKIPPTYIKPISGGRITDGFGYRNSTMAGMTTNHKAVDWSTPVGTSVSASCGGVVTQAGWLGTYGYVIFISHPDGRETRYAHLSKILVSKGERVSQGQKIALTGNTGASTGPHLHFEMRIGGVAVNPLKYLD